MPDPFTNFSSGLQSPASGVFSIPPDDLADLPTATRALNVAQSGTVQVTTVDGSTATLYVVAGIAFPVRVQRVHATGTTATGIVGLI
ncbi:MAG: hypothetical protein R3256_07405 [Thalassovita sp.]|nr:hypothetical protein [Thalassovita sp.]